MDREVSNAKSNRSTKKKILEKCSVILEGEEISKELLLESFADYFFRTINKEKHNVGIVLHTGSVCFDAIAIIYAMAVCLVYNQANSENIVCSLNPGDRVLYGTKQRARFVFQGIEEVPDSNIVYAKLSQGRARITSVPKKMWRYIFPDMGTSSCLDGRGIRKQSGIKEIFYKSVLEYEETDIPSLADISVAVVIPRNRAEFLMDNLELRFDDKKVKPLELVTASYFTENEEWF